MSYVTREQISTALFNLLGTASFTTSTGVSGFQTTGRRFRQWDDIAKCLKPALFLMEQKEHIERGDSQASAVRTIMYDAYIFINDGLDRNAVPMTTLNNIVDSIDPQCGGVLFPNTQSNRQTLSGLAYDCFIDGEVDKVPGDFDGQGIAIIPIKVIMAS